MKQIPLAIVMIAAVSLQGCAYIYTPKIAEGVGDQPGAFDRRIQTTFPPGTAAADVVSALRPQGFKFGSTPSGTPYAFRENWCSAWSVNWTVDARDRIASITGQEPRCAGP